MRKLWFPGLMVALLWSACSNEFDVAAPYKDIPVVYGIISPDDTAHYIRVERAFINADSSAFEVAQIADSIYYAEGAISVFLERVSTGQRFQLQRVDGTFEGYIREQGTFANFPNWLYKVKPTHPGDIVKPGEKYKLVIERADGRPAVTAETTVPNTLMLVSPNPEAIPPQVAIYGNSVLLDWRTSASGVLFDVYMKIRYREIQSNGNVTLDSIRWKVARNVVRENTLISGGVYRGKTTFSPQAFYSALLGHIQAPDNVVSRYFNGIDFEIQGAGPEIADYQESEAINAGLTGAEISTRYTNLSEGYGIFTARRTWHFNDFGLRPGTVDSLNADPTRKEVLKFKG
ncbi:MAG: DUF4249 family protein [Saprospiraceae bacterium]|nr:DUF4249 family protein [Saprospiraceae bacterium]